MATLTWRDVAAPNIRAPDLTSSIEAITRGIAGFGQSVQALANAPEDRRKAALANEMALLDMQQKGVANQAMLGSQLEKVLKADRQENAIKEFGAAQSTLEATARDAGLSGKSYDDFLKNDAFLALSPDARALAASHLSDAFWQGDQARQSRLEQARQDARMRETLAMQRREHSARMSAYERAAKDADKEKDPYAGIIDPESRAALLAYRKRVLANLARASGAPYMDKSLADAAKMGGVEDLSEAVSAFSTYNANRAKRGLDPLPEDVMKELIAGGSGRNTFPYSVVNDYDPDQFMKDLDARGVAYDAAIAAERLLRDREKFVQGGGKLSDADLTAQLEQLMRGTVQPARVPVPGKPGVSRPAPAASVPNDFRFYSPGY